MASTSELQAAFDNIIEVQAPIIEEIPEGESTLDWIRREGLVVSRAFTDGVFIGFRAEGVSSLVALAKALRAGDVRYMRGARLQAFTERVVDEIVALKRGGKQGQVQQADLAKLEAGIASWFDQTTRARTYLIPCAILPESAQTFEIGSVRFEHGSSFDPTSFGLPSALHEISLKDLDQTMRQRSAGWLATVEVTGYEPDRAAETAAVAVDLALAGLQLVVPMYYSQRMSRITGRTLPPFVVSMVKVGGQISAEHTNSEAGRGMPGSEFDKLVQLEGGVLRSAGERIRALTTGGGALPWLEITWCNAAFWFHEGLAEPLASVSISKFEVAAENMFGSSGISMSKARIFQAIGAFFGLGKSDPIVNGSAVKVVDYVEKLIESRSRILHGNWSTLTEELPLSREETAEFTRTLLLNYTLWLDRYMASSSPADDHVAFLTWVHGNR